MSLITQLQTALGVAFLLTTAGALSVTAQTPAAVDSSEIRGQRSEVRASSSINKAATTAAPTSEPEKAELTETPTLAEKRTLSEKTAAVSRLARYENPFAFAATRPIAVAKPATFTATEAPRSPQAVDADKWHFQFSPYFWLVGIHGTTGVGNRTAGVDMSFSDIFGSLKFAAMGTFEARKGKLVVLVDTEYASLEDDRATPGPFFSDVTASFKQFIFDPEVGYRVYEDPDKGASIDILGGIRVWHVSTELDFGAGILPALNLQGSRTWVDGIFGMRGRIALSEKAFVTGKVDVGAGGSEFTWQTFGGLGYNIKPNIALIGGYRVLDVKYRDSNFLYDVNQRGPIMGLGFRF